MVILAGTDRLDDDEDSDTFRKPLAPHEILNALGRAGRAGQAATGVAIIVPGEPIGFDPLTKALDENIDLPVVFADGDQCLPLGDPLTTLFDQIEVAGVPTPEADYLLRRLSDVLGDDGEAFEALARRTLGFYRRATLNAPQADAWVAGRRVTLIAAIQARAEPPALPWEEALAAKTGVSRRLITALAQAYPGAPHDQPDALPWVLWLLDQLDPAQPDFDTVLRPEALERVFGRALSTQPDNTARRRAGLDGLRIVLPAWFAGEPLLVIEQRIAGFIAATERDVRRPTRPDPKAKHARRFAQRLASDLGYLCGILNQVSTGLLAGLGAEPPPMVTALPQLMRKGYQTPYHFALSRSFPALSRVGVYGEYAAIAPLLTRDAMDDWTTVREKITNANASLIFNALDDDDPLG